MKAVIYSRVSTDRQANEGISLEAQLERARDYAKRQGLEVIGEYCDAGISGKAMKNRPEFIQALDLVCAEKAVLVFYSLSRISRSTRDLMDISDRIQKSGAGMASLVEQIDTTTAMGSFLFTVLAALAALERELISERTRSALSHLRAQGRISGKIGYGYTGTADGRLIENPEEQAVLTLMYTWRQEEWMNYKDIAARLNRAKIPAKNGGVWHCSPLRRMLLQHKKRLDELAKQRGAASDGKIISAPSSALAGSGDQRSVRATAEQVLPN